MRLTSGFDQPERDFALCPDPRVGNLVTITGRMNCALSLAGLKIN